MIVDRQTQTDRHVHHNTPLSSLIEDEVKMMVVKKLAKKLMRMFRIIEVKNAVIVFARNNCKNYLTPKVSNYIN